MSRQHRSVPVLIGLLAASLPSPAVAAETRPAVLHPLAAGGATPAELRSVQALLQSALEKMGAAGPFAPGAPAVLKSACKPAKKPDPSCVAKSAGKGVVLVATVASAGQNLEVSILAVDADAKTFGPVRARVARKKPDVPSIEIALRDLGALATPPPVVVVAPPPPPPPPPPPTIVVTAPPPPPPPAPKPNTRGRVGVGLAAGGTLALAGGVVLGVLARSLDAELREKYAAHVLQPSDAASYDRVRSYGLAATSLLVVGGAMAATGAGVWAWSLEVRAHEKGAQASVSGSF